MLRSSFSHRKGEYTLSEMKAIVKTQAGKCTRSGGFIVEQLVVCFHFVYLSVLFSSIKIHEMTKTGNRAG